MFRELEKERTEWAEQTEGQGDDFVISLVGESRLYSTSRKEAVHGVKCSVRHGSSLETFCAEFGLHKSARFETSLYGMEVASTLARFWQHRVQFLFQIWDTSVPAHQNFSLEAMSSYVVPEDAAELLESLKGRALQRAMAVRDMAPAF